MNKIKMKMKISEFWKLGLPIILTSVLSMQPIKFKHKNKISAIQKGMLTETPQEIIC